MKKLHNLQCCGNQTAHVEQVSGLIMCLIFRARGHEGILDLNFCLFFEENRTIQCGKRAAI